ncbi:MAG TPA: hypothetical protein VNC40_03270 [Gaiellaceae bacterium]|nr:hypothetical protein [Gaiellaceae bacterium]
MIRTLEQAAAFVEEVGLALLLPKADERGFLWNAKDELPAHGLVRVGKHVARVAT